MIMTIERASNGFIVGTLATNYIANSVRDIMMIIGDQIKGEFEQMNTNEMCEVSIDVSTTEKE